MKRLTTSILLVLAAFPFLSGSLSAQIHFPDFTSLEGISLMGAATARNSSLLLTPLQQSTAGAVWITRQQQMTEGFITRFQFRIKDTLGQPDRDSRNGGDGIAFVIHNSPYGSSSLGGSGGHIGYGTIEKVALAVEFDTYNNSDQFFGDLSGNHISVQTGNSRNYNSLGLAERIPNLSDGRIHTATIEYYRGTLSVFLDACAPVQIAVDMVLPEFAWVGLTSATGAAWESHEILSWEFNPLGADRNYRGQPCDADAVTLTVRGDFASYRWSTGETTKSITVNRSGRYTVEVADTSACSALTFSWDETVDLGTLERPTISASGPRTFCAGDSVILTANGNHTRWNWSPVGGTTRSIVARTAGTYFVVAYDSRGCQSISDTMRVSILPRPSVTIDSSGPLTLCQGKSVTLTADSGHALYRWSNGERTRSIVVDSAGRYTVTVTSASGCQGVSEPVDVTIQPAPAPVITVEGRNRCESDSVTLDAGPGYSAYVWSSGERTRKIIARGGGTWSVTVTSLAGCTGTSDPITILPGGVVPPTIRVIGALPFCAGDSVTLRAEGEFRTYRWSNGATAGSIVVGRGGVYSVTVTDSAGCESSASIVVQETTAPPEATIAASGATALCDGDSIVLSIPAASSPVLWSTGSTTSSIVVRTAGLYHVTVGSGRCIARDSITIDLATRPTASAGPDREICLGDSVVLNATGGTSYTWSPAAGLSCTDCSSPTATPSTTMGYIVEVGSGGTCTAFDTVIVVVNQGARIDLGPDRTICSGDSVRLVATGAAGYRWSPSTGLSCSDCASPVAMPLATTRYIVTSSGRERCLVPDTITVTVDDIGLKLRTSIERGVGGAPGETVAARLLLDAEVDSAAIDSIDLVVGYNPRVALADPTADILRMTTGTRLAGWSGSVDNTVPGRLELHLGAPAGAALQGSGALLSLPFRLFIGDSTGTELTYDLTAYGDRCLSPSMRPGRIEIDSICGLSYRLIEIGTTKYALGEVTPNPSSSSARITFAVGLDAPTTIRLFDMAGHEVGRPIDETLASGEYQLQIETSALPSGLYFLRMESGEYMATRRLMVE